MATYGSFPGVKITTIGGGITGVEVGENENLVIFGPGDPANGTASVNSATEIGMRADADGLFGKDSELADAVKHALDNEANPNFIWGVMPEQIDVGSGSSSGSSSGPESFSATQTGNVANYPIVEDESLITVRDTVNAVDFSVNFRFESAPTTPTAQNTVNINPLTGEFAASTSSDFDVEYSYYDWETAFESAHNVIDEDESGVYTALSDSLSVASDLSGVVSGLREQYKMAYGICGAEPNATGENGEAMYDAQTYTDTIDNDSMFLAAPVRLQNSKATVLGGLGGMFAGAGIREPIYNDTLQSVEGMEQKITRAEADDFRDSQVIPVRQRGSVRVEDNLSTSTELDWQRDFWRRRIVDRTILIGKQVGEAIIGRINNAENRNEAEATLFAELDDMEDMGLLEPRDSGEGNDAPPKWDVRVYESAPDEASIDMEITPQGVIKRVPETITVNTR